MTLFLSKHEMGSQAIVMLSDVAAICLKLVTELGAVV